LSIGNVPLPEFGVAEGSLPVLDQAAKEFRSVREEAAT
jgi:hypothetical protein